MRQLSFLLAAVALCFATSCGKDNDSASQADNKGQEQTAKGKKTTPGLIAIDQEAQAKAGIQTFAAGTRKVDQYLAAAGQIVVNEDHTAHVGTYVAGRVSEVSAKMGDDVKRGAVLARMHSHDVHEVRAAYQTALEGVSRQQNMVSYQQRMRERMQRLYDLKSASKQELEKAESDLRGAQTDLANARIAVTRESAHLSDILHLPESQLNQINETSEEVPVVAPIAGTVIARMVTPGAVVEPGQEVFTLTDLSSVWMLASVSEADIAKVRVGRRARVLTSAFPGEQFDGTVNRLSNELDLKTRTLQARILIPNRERKLRVGMYVNAEIAENTSRDAIYIPETAIQDVNGSSVVFVANDPGTFQMRPIQIAHRLNGEAEVSNGLRRGEMVAGNGSFVIKSEMLKSQIGE